MVLVESVADGDKHRVTLITLHGFQILDEEVLTVFRTHGCFHIRIVAEENVHLTANQLLLTGREGSNA